MRVFFDENMPRPLRHVLDGYDISFVEKQGWKGKENGELLALVEAEFDVMLTSDSNIEYQNRFRGRDLSMIVVPTNRLTILRANALAIRVTLDQLAGMDHHVIVTIDWRGRRSLRRLDTKLGSQIDMDPVTAFGR